MLQGPNLELYKHLVTSFPEVNWIASGGVSRINDLNALKKTGVSGVIVGKAIYEGKIALNQLSNF
jgi:phosphoribosylformimino-5-aminoimidazole carboxamide ribotide isomerase